MVLKYKETRGDTIIEVMFATAVAALMIVLTITLMNRSLAQTQLAVEITFARHAIDSQAEALRYFRDQYIKTSNDSDPSAQNWVNVLAMDNGNPITSFGVCPNRDNPHPSPNAFYINGLGGNEETSISSLSAVTPSVVSGASNFNFPQTFARAGNGVWIEVKRGSDNKYADFHIRACWNPPFDSSENVSLGTVVRLYYERGEYLANNSNIFPYFLNNPPNINEYLARARKSTPPGYAETPERVMSIEWSNSQRVVNGSMYVVYDPNINLRA